MPRQPYSVTVLSTGGRLHPLPYHLDNFKNRQVKEKDYSIGEVLQPDGRYAMYYEGGEKIILSPNEELVKVLKSVAPRKVFSE